MSEFWWFLFALILLWILWVLTGGYERVENKDKPFIDRPTEPFQAGDPYTYDEFKERY